VVEEGSEKGLGSLKLWQRAVELAEYIHKTVLPALPADEKWCLTQQLRRSAQSVPANIAEGYGRFYYQEGIRFCYIARGSWKKPIATCTWLTGWVTFLNRPCETRWIKSMN
jgi:hypothetical protein